MTPQEKQAVSLVQQWHTALNIGDVASLVALLDTRVQLVGPRGTAEGVHLVKEWVERAKVKLLPQRYFALGDTVLIEEVGEWYTPGAESGTESQVVFTVFSVHNGSIVSIQRHPDLETAQAASGVAFIPEVHPE
jgi:ketosteroid isomerase-like protein